MNLLIKNIFASLVLFAICLQAQAGKGYVTNLDFTDPTTYTINYLGESKKLRKVQWNAANPRMDDTYFLGMYTGPMDWTGGFTLHIFPNNRYALIGFCDICGNTVLSTGTWSKIGNEITLKANATFDDPKQVFGLKTFTSMYGDISKLSFFIVAKDEFIGDSIIVPATRLKSGPIDNFLVRKEKYIDWAHLDSSFANQISQQVKEP